MIKPKISERSSAVWVIPTADDLFSGENMENEKKIHRCCFIGSNPETLILKEESVKPMLEKEISNAIADGYTTFITGMSPGVDIWAAEIILEKKATTSRLKLICAIPHREYGKTKDYKYNISFKRIIGQADLVKEIFPVYNVFCYRKRNEWMIEHSNRIIAVYNGSQDGTKEIINFASKNGLEIRLA